MPEAARALPDSISALPPGTRLGEFEVRGLLGVGGFGIVYRAFDHALEREVAIKEYMPASMAGRTETLHVSLRSQGDAEVFALGLKSFVNEARLLARFDHPSLIKVHRFWEANGTAYMSMPVLRGPTLKDLRRDGSHRTDEAWMRAILAPLLGALECLHNEDVYHRDIAPDNIHLERDGRLPVLLDFGAARRVISGKTQSLTAILKPAYAPIEQYGETGTVKQGPWTDLYALGATLHYMLMGYPPAPATARTLSGESSGLTSQALPGCSAQLLAIVDWMLAPRPEDRPQSVAELRRVLEGRAPMPHRPVAPAPPSRRDASADAAPAITVPLGEVEHAHLELEMTAGPAVTGPAPVQGTAARAAQQDTPRQAEVLRMAADGAHRLRPPPSRSRLLPLALVSAVLAGGLGYAGWTRLAPPGAAAVAPAASAPSLAEGVANTAAATAPTTAPTAEAAPTAPVVVPPTSGIATVSAASGAAAGAVDAGGAAAMPAATPPAAEARDTTTVIAPAPSSAEAPRPRPAEAASPAEAPPPPRAGGTTDPPRPEGPAGTAGTAVPAGATPLAGTGGTQARAAPTATARPAERSRAAPLPGAAAEPPPNATPEGLCKGLSEAAHFVCMERECLRARFRNHPECR